MLGKKTAQATVAAHIASQSQELYHVDVSEQEAQMRAPFQKVAERVLQSLSGKTDWTTVTLDFSHLKDGAAYVQRWLQPSIGPRISELNDSLRLIGYDVSSTYKSETPTQIFLHLRRGHAGTPLPGVKEKSYERFGFGEGETPWRRGGTSSWW